MKLIIPFKPQPSQLILKIRAAASESKNVRFSVHALERMEQRSITTLDALRVLQSGEIRGNIESGVSEGEWKCKVVKQMKGTREIGVITIVMSHGNLFIKTVEWEDL